MASPPPGLDSELESFRQQWLSDLRSRKTEPSSQPPPAAPPPAPAPDAPGPRRPPPDDGDASFRVDELPARAVPPRRPLVSALDHYEEAMAREAQGNMGDSLQLYRRAYRLDHRVDRRYHEKHFPPASTDPSGPPPPRPPAPADAPPAPRPSTADLIASMAGFAIAPAPPAIDGDPPPPCPLAGLPSELLVHILADVAAADPGALAAAARACKRLAYLVATDLRVWRPAALSSAFGFPAMRYRFGRAAGWDPPPPPPSDAAAEPPSDAAAEPPPPAAALVPAVYPSWRDMFRARPRVRFNGCYISTVNYVRSGQLSTNQATWGGDPIHIVTYYRYLRLLRDGSAISLLTTAEPADVVPLLTPDLLRQLRDPRAGDPRAAGDHPMRRALHGRWRLGPDPGPDAGCLFVETEGAAGPAYLYRMDLALRSAGPAARNNKLVWRAFHSYNKLTDDWAEFCLDKNKPFFFSRVRSYGMGE